MNGHELYRHFDADGKLLYIGISKSAFARLLQHQSTSHWSSKIASMTIERFDSRKQLKAAEKIAIAWERPAHNIDCNPVASPNYTSRHGAVAILDRCKEQGVTPLSAKSVIYMCGGSKAMQDLFGISKASVSNWKVIPDTRCVPIERKFGIPCSLMRPDIFPPDWIPLELTDELRSDIEASVSEFREKLISKNLRSA